jgi:hypothetical protein
MLDRLLGLSGSFTGTAVIEPDDGGYTWRETGTVTWDGRSVAAFRNLALRREDGRWWMTFADGRPFHPWLLDEPVIHPCAADTYRGVITRPGEDELTITWLVDGPAKDQLIESILRR